MNLRFFALTLTLCAVSGPASAHSVGGPREPASLRDRNHPEITPELMDIERTANIDARLTYWNALVHEGRDFERNLAKYVEPSSLKEIGAVMNQVGEMPKIRRVYHTLYLDYKEAQIIAQWPDFSRFSLTLGGINMVYDESQSFAANLGIFKNKVKLTEKTAFNFFSGFWLPDADAGVASKVFEILLKGKGHVSGGASTLRSNLTTSAFVATAGFIGTNFSAATCFMASLAGGTRFFPVCKQLKKEADDDKEAIFTKVLGAIKKDPNEEWIGLEPQCPVVDDKGNSTLDAEMILTNHITGNDGKGKFWHFKGKLDKSRRFTEASVYRSYADSQLPDSANAAEFKLHFDTTVKGVQINEIEEKDPSIDASLGTPYNPVTLDSTSDPAKLGLFGRMQFMAEGAQFVFIMCQTTAYTALFSKKGAEQAVKQMMDQPVVVPASGGTDVKK